MTHQRAALVKILTSLNLVDLVDWKPQGQPNPKNSVKEANIQQMLRGSRLVKASDMLTHRTLSKVILWQSRENVNPHLH